MNRHFSRDIQMAKKHVNILQVITHYDSISKTKELDSYTLDCLHTQTITYSFEEERRRNTDVEKVNDHIQIIGGRQSVHKRFSHSSERQQTEVMEIPSGDE